MSEDTQLMCMEILVYMVYIVRTVEILGSKVITFAKSAIK